VHPTNITSQRQSSIRHATAHAENLTHATTSGLKDSPNYHIYFHSATVKLQSYTMSLITDS